MMSPRAPGNLKFTFDGRSYTAHPGDTLAAALLANGVRVVARSFKYHRPRGVLSAGVEEPNALVTVGEGARRTPNTRATDVFVYDGLVARSQNAWPSVAFDVGAVLGLAAPIFAAGFYYKTFFGPPKLWRVYEYFIRRAAGLGEAPVEADPDTYAQRAAFCDLLVVGSGPAGLVAARDAALNGTSVMLVEHDAVLGGSLLRDGGELDLMRQASVAIAAAGGRVLTRTTASGVWDDGMVTLDQRRVEPGQSGAPAHCVWHVRAKKIVLATGALERPLTFANNDRPGVMLSSAVRTYIKRFGVLPGKRVVIATNNDDAYATADAVIAAGGEIVAVLDERAESSAIATQAGQRFCVHLNAQPRNTRYARGGLSAVEAVIGERREIFAADLLAMSGGFTPVVHLHSQAQGKLDWRADIQAFVPGATSQNMAAVGAAAGDVELIAANPVALPDPKYSFIDFQNDVTASDIDLAWAEGYRSVEHLKRYTTLGMATDQGKTSNMAALARLAGAAGVDVPQAGLTTFRPPYVPLTLGALAGADAGGDCAPERQLALRDTHVQAEAVWMPLGLWMRPRAYPQGSETLGSAAVREALAVRTKVGLTDVSSLAKFAISGPDAIKLLEMVCATPVAKLAIGRGRYTFMLREDGMVMDDGTLWRLGEQRYLLTSSTGGADRMTAHLGYAHYVLGAGLRVSVVGQQEHFAGFALAGPRACDSLAALTNTPPPAHMGHSESWIAGVPVRILAASYSGERAFEIYAVAHDARPVWDALEAQVRAQGGALYGIDAMEHLRISKGHVVIGAEADGRATPDDLGLAGMLRKVGGYIGASGLARTALSAPDRHQLVGLESLAGAIPEGAMLLTTKGAPVDGHVTSSGAQIVRPGFIALAMLKGGRARVGETLLATSPTRRLETQVRVTAAHFYDPQGERYRD